MSNGTLGLRAPWFFAGSLLTLLGSQPLAAQDTERPSFSGLRIDSDSEPVVLDGTLDEPFWTRAPVATDLRQREPLEGEVATEVTEVRVVYDERSIYIGIRARDGEPDAVIARILQRDRVMEAHPFEGVPRFAGDDAVAILLDTFHDHRNAVVFATNPNGAEFDALITDEGREFNVDWRGVWEVRAQRTADGWSAELEIPFRTLRYPRGVERGTWGFNVYRVIRRKNEEVLWSGWSRANEGFHRVSAAGNLEGLDDLPQTGLNLEMKPYVLGGGTQEQEAGEIDSDPRFDVGLDAKYEVRPGLVLDVTLNTDFAQVEVDDEQVNLTRFSLFFPEKREFFLENAGIFEFGTRGGFEPPPFLLFFSRRIGIAEDGEVPLLGGLRLTGRVGAQTIGFLDVVTDSAYDEPRSNFAVARVKRDVGGRHFIGAMVTDRRWANGWNTAGGLDWSFWPAAALNVQGFVAATGTSGPGGDDYAYRIAVDYQQDRFGLSTQYLMIGPEANADVGFITREDIRRADVFMRFTPRPDALGLRKIDLYLFAGLVTRVDGLLQDWSLGPVFGPEWNSGDSFTLFYQIGFNRVDEEFDISDKVLVPPGDYDLWQFGWFAGTSRNRRVVLGLNGALSGTFGGHIHTVAPSLTFNPNANLSTSLRYSRSWIDLPGGAFTANVGSLRLSYAFTTRLVANALLQYNDADNAASAQIRLNFIHSPGSDLYVVFNEQRGTDDSLWEFSDRGAVVKITYLIRF
ncbi:MAG: carbohydrate binding family 9 domain-containing protein [Gemmatimonadota bacterium]|nr:MAG: carbohydrate binding family 9 domain-containing protein [Gemmatimonadota bacterium]